MSRKHLLISIITSVVLLTVTFIPLASQQNSSYDPWIDANDDGIIDVHDLQALASIYGTSGESINKTNLLLDLQDRVEALENQSGWLPAPAYDSGWVSINQGQEITLTHNLNTTNVLVHIMGKFPQGFGIHIVALGGDDRSNNLYGLFWRYLDDTTIRVYRLPEDTSWWQQVRVMIWKIQEPPA